MIGDNRLRDEEERDRERRKGTYVQNYAVYSHTDTLSRKK